MRNASLKWHSAAQAAVPETVNCWPFSWWFAISTAQVAVLSDLPDWKAVFFQLIFFCSTTVQFIKITSPISQLGELNKTLVKASPRSKCTTPRFLLSGHALGKRNDLCEDFLYHLFLSLSLLAHDRSLWSSSASWGVLTQLLRQGTGHTNENSRQARQVRQWGGLWCQGGIWMSD